MFSYKQLPKPLLKECYRCRTSRKRQAAFVNGTQSSTPFKNYTPSGRFFIEPELGPLRTPDDSRRRRRSSKEVATRSSATSHELWTHYIRSCCRRFVIYQSKLRQASTENVCPVGGASCKRNHSKLDPLERQMITGYLKCHTPKCTFEIPNFASAGLRIVRRFEAS
jgi:hypothetical protein